MKIPNEKQAFEVKHRGFVAKAFWGDAPDARIEITRDGVSYKTIEYPAYRIFNIAAHFNDMIDDLLSKEEQKITLWKRH